MLICYQLSEFESNLSNRLWKYGEPSKANIAFLFVINHTKSDYAKFEFLMLIHVFFMISNFSQEEDFLFLYKYPPNIKIKFEFAVIPKEDFAINIFFQF